MVHRCSRAICLLLVGLVCACATNNDRGTVLYGEGRYIEAAELFEHSEEQLMTFALAERARYGLYRGMTLLKLGDVEGAAKWLDYARDSEAHTPNSLKPSDRKALEFARAEVEALRAPAFRSPDLLHDALAHSTVTTESPSESVTPVGPAPRSPSPSDSRRPMTAPRALDLPSDFSSNKPNH